MMPSLWRAWTWEPLVVLGVGVTAVWYAVGLRRLWQRAGVGRVVGLGHAWLFAVGLLVAGLALVSPLDALGEVLFSAHMTQHLVLILIAAPLLVLGRPQLPLLWALPEPWRRSIGRWWAAGPATRMALTAITLPSVVWVAHAAALGFWHIPVPYAWALGHESIHAIEHASFLVTAYLFWWVVFQPVGRRRLGYGAAVIYVSALAGVMGVFAAVLTFARTPWYVGHVHGTAVWGLTALEDQQLAGLIMWIPASLVYLAAASFCFVQWLETDDRASSRQPLGRPLPSQEPSYGVSSVVS
jgi:putative membrane protein